MDTQSDRIMAVIDPTRNEQWALKRAISIGKSREHSTILAYLCVHWKIPCDDPVRVRSVELERCRLWLDYILEEYADQAVKIEPLVEWNADWREGICKAARSARSDLVIKRASGRPRSLANSDRDLIRQLNDRALLLVKHDPAASLKKVLVAIDFNSTDASHAGLNAAIMDRAKRIRGRGDEIELHSVSAYPTSDRFVHPPDVARILGISRSQAHVRRGAAGDVIPEAANNIRADLVIVGNVGRRGLSGITVGNTAEKILTDIDADVLVLVNEMQREYEAA